VALSLSLAACTNANVTPTTVPQAPPTPPSPLLTFVATAPPGARQVVPATVGGSRFAVTVLERYTAASGRTCKRLLLVEQAPGGRTAERVACANGATWALTPSLQSENALGL